MGTYQKRGGFGGGGPDRKGGAGKSFDRSAWKGGHGAGRARETDGKQREMFKTTCTSCGAACDVPFRPTGERPVFCRDCFSKNAGTSAPSPRRPLERPPFNDRQVARPQPGPHAHGAELVGLRKQLDAIQVKVDMLLSLMQSSIAHEKQADVREALVHATDAAPKIKKSTLKKKPAVVKKKATKKK